MYQLFTKGPARLDRVVNRRGDGRRPLAVQQRHPGPQFRVGSGAAQFVEVQRLDVGSLGIRPVKRFAIHRIVAGQGVDCAAFSSWIEATLA